MTKVEGGRRRYSSPSDNHLSHLEDVTGDEEGGGKEKEEEEKNNGLRFFGWFVKFIVNVALPDEGNELVGS